MIGGLPWWVYLMIFSVFLSGYMAFRAMRAEKKLDEHYIEHEGKIYMDRIEEERMRRRTHTHEN